MLLNYRESEKIIINTIRTEKNIVFDTFVLNVINKNVKKRKKKIVLLEIESESKVTKEFLNYILDGTVISLRC